MRRSKTECRYQLQRSDGIRLRRHGSRQRPGFRSRLSLLFPVARNPLIMNAAIGREAMGLRTKFNLAIIVAFLVGFAVTGVFLQKLFVEDARQQVLQDAGIMMSSANAIRKFTDTFIGPLAVPQNSSGQKFVAASVPSFAAQTTFKDVQARFPDFSYREPALNPTNPADRPTDWEADYINAFRNKPDLKELTSEREAST